MTEQERYDMYKSIFEDFKRDPRVDENRIASWKPHKRVEIDVEYTNGDVVRYEYFEKRIWYIKKEGEYVDQDIIWRTEFAANLRLLMRRKGMDQSWLAQESGLTQASISGYVRGKRVPSIESCIKMAKALGCSIEELSSMDEYH